MMRRLIHCCVALILIASVQPSLSGQASGGEKPNILLICVDDLRPELNCYGVDYIHSPNIDRLAAQGRIFESHYVQAPTCGASRYALLTGSYGSSSNSALFQRAEALSENPEGVPPSMPAWFRQHGYRTVAVGKVSHHPGGMGGEDWSDESELEMPLAWDKSVLEPGPWQHPRGWMHGLAQGEIRRRAGEMDVIQAMEGPDSIYPDGINTERALEELELLAGNASEQPFFLAFGILRPHLPFGAPAEYLELYQEAKLPSIPHPTKPDGRTTWHKSGEFYKYNRWGRDPNTDADFATEVRRHYAACVSFADAQVGRMLERLDDLGLHENTVVVLWGDHGWHLGEHAIWGKHALFEESLRSPLIISYPNMPRQGEASTALVESVDIFPTLLELAGLPEPGRAEGVSLVPILRTPEAEGHDVFGYFGKGLKTIRTTTHRMILHRDGFVELYDHRRPEGETLNVAGAQTEIVESLRRRIEARFQ